MEEQATFSIKNDIKSLLDYIISLIHPPSVSEQKKAYIKKNGYPKESVTFSDSYGRIGKITGINTYKRLLDDPAIQRMRKQIEENN